MAEYDWLIFHDDGSIGFDVKGATRVQVGRRLVISQELRAGRIVLASQLTAAQERIAELERINEFDRTVPIREAREENERLRERTRRIVEAGNKMAAVGDRLIFHGRIDSKGGADALNEATAAYREAVGSES